MLLTLEDFKIQGEGKASQYPVIAEMNIKQPKLYIKHKCANVLVCACGQNIESLYLSDTCYAQKFLVVVEN